VIVDDGDHGFDRRSSSAAAKYADALRRISLAWRSSRFSRSSAFSFADSSAGASGDRPLLRSAFWTHSRSVCGEQPNFPAIETSAAQREACSPSCSTTIRTARSRTSGENLFVVGIVIGSIFLGVGVSGKSRAVQKAPPWRPGRNAAKVLTRINPALPPPPIPSTNRIGPVSRQPFRSCQTRAP